MDYIEAMKRSIGIILIMMFSLSGINAQVNWADSLQFKGKIIAANEKDGYIYFATKKGKGVYHRAEKKVVIAPLCQFIQKFNSNKESGFFIVINNKCGVVRQDGTPMHAPNYRCIGFNLNYTDDVLIKDDSTYAISEGITYPNHNVQLSSFNSEESVECKNGMVILRSYKPHTSEQVYGLSSVGEDSLVINYIPGIKKSGVYSLKTGQWIIPPKHGAVKIINGNIMTLRDTLLRDTLKTLLTVFSPDGNQIGIIEYSYGMNEKIAKLLLSAYQPDVVRVIEIPRIERTIILFRSNGKYGLMNNVGDVLIAPDQYDYIHCPYHESENCFLFKKGKVTMYSIQSGKQFYLEGYSDLQEIVSGIGYETRNVIQCNKMDWEDDKSKLHVSETLSPFGPLPDRYTISNSGIEVDSTYLIIHDYKRHATLDLIYEESFDEMGNFKMDTMVIDAYGTRYPYRQKPNTGTSRSGVLNMETGKWIVPNRFSTIIKSGKGYACYYYNYDTILFSFFTGSGKMIFDKIDQSNLMKNSSYMNYFTGLNHSGQVNFEYLVNERPKNLESNVRIKSGKKQGVYSFKSAKILLHPVWDYVDGFNLHSKFLVVDSNRIGFYSENGEEILPPNYSHLHSYNSGAYLEMDGHLIYDFDSVLIKVNMDTIYDSRYPSSDRYKKYTASNYETYGSSFDAEIRGSKIYIHENDYQVELPYYDEYGNVEYGTLDSTYTRIVDLKSGQRLDLEKAWESFEMKNGFCSMNSEGVYYLNARGKAEVFLYGADSILMNSLFITKVSADNRYLMDNSLKISKNDKVNKTYFSHQYHPVGFKYEMFKDGHAIKFPPDHVPQVVGNDGTVLCYTIDYNKTTKEYSKRYVYFNPTTKTSSPTELPLTGGQLQVYALNDYILMMEYDYSKLKYNCFVLEYDLKTIKSTFKDVKYFSAGEPIGHNPVPYFKLSTVNKVMFFDGQFQFMFEAPAKEGSIDGVTFPTDDVEVRRGLRYYDFMFNKRKFRVDLRGYMIVK